MTMISSKTWMVWPMPSTMWMHVSLEAGEEVGAEAVCACTHACVCGSAVLFCYPLLIFF